jgi:Ni/Fe-hydrogenase subunit HybB-like protein
MAALCLAFVALRVAEIAWSGELHLVAGWHGVVFLAEIALFTYPAVRLLQPSYRRNPGLLFWAAQLVVAAGALYRFDTYLVNFDPGGGWSYFPSLGEIVFSMGLLAIGVAIYTVAVKRLPILTTVERARSVPVRPAARAAGSAR